MNPKIIDIYSSLVNGQRRQMVQQIDEYGPCDFWPDFQAYLKETTATDKEAFDIYADACKSYSRIKARRT